MSMFNINYCSEDFLIYYKANFELEFLPLYLSQNKEAIRSIFNKDVVIEGDTRFDHHSLFNSSDFDDNSIYFTKNVKLIYSMLSEITRTQATKEEFWFTMVHTYFLDYLMKYVETIKNNKNVSQLIKNAIFFNHGNTRSLVVNHISKYWWIGARTYDEEYKQNPYWLTDFFTETDATGKSIAFFSSKFTNNKQITLGIIEGIKIYAQEGKVKNKKETYSYVNEYFNYTGGVRILDIMSRDQVKRETMKILDDLISGKSEVDSSKKKRILNYLV